MFSGMQVVQTIIRPVSGGEMCFYCGFYQLIRKQERHLLSRAVIFHPQLKLGLLIPHWTELLTLTFITIARGK